MRKEAHQPPLLDQRLENQNWKSSHDKNVSKWVSQLVIEWVVDGKVDLWLSYILTTKITKDKRKIGFRIRLEIFPNFFRYAFLLLVFCQLHLCTFLKNGFFLRRSYLCEFKRNHIHIINITTCPIIFARSL